jgi:hypothetical protein
MPGGSRKNADHVLAANIASGRTVKESAKRAGVSEKTARRRMRDEDFCSLVDDLRAEAVERAMRSAEAAAPDAVKRLRELLVSGRGSVALGAARTLFAHAQRRAELAELLPRIEARERALGIEVTPRPPAGDEEEPEP